MNIINQSGLLAISTRLQRLSDRIRKDGALIYALFDIDFEPKWFPVIYTLHHKGAMGIMDLADEIGYAHPSTISLVKELEKKKLVQSKKDKTDERKRMISLTSQGENLIVKMKPVWKFMTGLLQKITDTPTNLMTAIAEVEEQLDRQGFYQRALPHLPAATTSRGHSRSRSA
jgi:DNA-binding MarR family transcriptional regulator